jgi:hypothetical protein
MEQITNTTRIWQKPLLLAGLLLLASGIGYRMWDTRDITWHWQDEVVLADKSRVWVARTEVREALGGGEPFRAPMRTTKLTTLELPSAAQSVVWSGRMEPLIVERGEAAVEWVLIATPIWCDEYRQFGSPVPPYVEFEFINGAWKARSVEKRWYGKKSNLLLNEIERAKRTGEKVTSEKIATLNSQVLGDLQRIQPTAKMNCDGGRGYRSTK